MKLWRASPAPLQGSVAAGSKISPRGSIRPRRRLKAAPANGAIATAIRSATACPRRSGQPSHETRLSAMSLDVELLISHLAGPLDPNDRPAFRHAAETALAASDC